MTDTEILDHILEWLKPYVSARAPIAPSSSEYAVSFIERTRTDRRTEPSPALRELMSMPEIPYNGPYPSLHEQRPHFDKDITEHQGFWRCAHHPEAITNYYAWPHCEHGCDRVELRWYDNGTCKPPTSSN